MPNESMDGSVGTRAPKEGDRTEVAAESAAENSERMPRMLLLRFVLRAVLMLGDGLDVSPTDCGLGSGGVVGLAESPA
eukprot:CAMPEP_0206420734 /NCGR_PEP_ID=MMETSP0324_2-20121206/1032_1 /ASSEMBLY_ACC=CAM_ASM_000836 /TAXON_ID=2866 /ORGANISM="Crypthecodinium cohnii, Strain Seligo" /LENGTH=77 /DNA_ID=CAMNT_0053884701 /DNA_START=930 /DNA_END=1163 /DNA_ORIENTATION=+